MHGKGCFLIISSAVTLTANVSKPISLAASSIPSRLTPSLDK